MRWARWKRSWSSFDGLMKLREDTRASTMAEMSFVALKSGCSSSDDCPNGTPDHIPLCSEYRNPGIPAPEQRYRERVVKQLERRAARFGFTLQPAAEGVS